MSEHDPRDDYDDEPWRRTLAPEKVRKAAHALWLFGLIQLTVSGFGFAYVIGHFISAQLDGVYAKYKPSELCWMLALSLVGVVWNGVLLWAAAGMYRAQGYRRSLTAAILGCLPLPCAYLGVFSVPIGIYSLVVLRKPDVRAHFAKVARATTNPLFTKPPAPP